MIIDLDKKDFKNKWVVIEIEETDTDLYNPIFIINGNKYFPIFFFEEKKQIITAEFELGIIMLDFFSYKKYNSKCIYVYWKTNIV
jgi:hypothetical protein